MQIKIKHIALTLFLVDALLLIINMEYRDQTASVIPDLDYAKIFFYLGTLSFTIYLKLIKSKEVLTLAAVIVITSLIISMFFNLRLAKRNYDRIQCNNGISEYFEYETCAKMEKRFETDLRNGEIKYFQFEYGSELELEETLRDTYDIELIGMGCTMLSSMQCYNDLVNDYLKKKTRTR